ncbi:hypothetical protein EMIHUDRAFT_250318 [Emiliania huxleyi CCMP1516]|uniref:Protein kinase domain-containing protein n=2 Tax=Emiliania huxleyi TaxID=2903 RepID=A0A0D3I1D3_EMIH1|nr:hypothetical protein EMIHUDRAFT_250318 [Emiliania huxleyi CCMP1516]EOD05068.1 hypothetical protein EMIHUDRAFT_250318 [Emiliania huxleyi CCMP1516]|eukprot:XP_005757497.1 hypothetical protein EMIHUDRAFT_250318 [Emiliania huxleyi CCMP1516]
MQECPDTCTTQADTSGHLLHTEDVGLQPSDYGKPLEDEEAKRIICEACRLDPEMGCCHNHPHDVSRGRQLGPSHIQYYAASMACGLQAIHDAKYLYRDLKPQNVLLDIEGR